MPNNISADMIEKGYETQDVPFRPFVWFVLAFSCALVGVLLGVILFTKALAKPGSVFGRVQHAAEKSLTAFPQPRLQGDPPADLRKYLIEKEQELTTYNWIDRRTGIVRVPIDRAIDLLLIRGLPVRPPDSGLTELDMQTEKAGAQKIIPPNARNGRNP
jgi:hypothetical protein